MDQHSFARPDQVRVTHADLDLGVDFAANVIRGVATLSIERMPGSPPTAPLILDARGLAIEKVATADPSGRWTNVIYTLEDTSPILGGPLTVPLARDDNSVRITYKTTERATALQWVSPSGTAGKKSPFLFTQSQAIHARSWIPIQDSPGVRLTYSATVRVPTGLTAVMSAERNEAGPVNTLHFDMPQPIPAYLIALAVGDLAFRPLGPRTGVWADPSVVQSAALELADTEAMVKAIEKRFGPYRWGRYDLLILPPSFPFGGMENPRLTFATPTILAGDRSLVSLVAHELAHSWSGNLVTNATWRDFWLNEGFTTYLERRVMEEVYSPSRAAMERVLGMRELRQELAELPARDQILQIDLSGRDPDDGMTLIPYEKGALFLTALEEAFGRATFDPFLNAYFEHFAFKSITTDDFVAYLRQNLFPKNDAAAKKIDLHAWIEEPGLPKDAPAAKSDRFAQIEEAVTAWRDRTIPLEKLAVVQWSTHEWLHFLQSLPETIPIDRMAELDMAFGFTRRGNAEIAALWLVIAVRNGYAAADERLESFLTTIGRRKFLVPLYRELMKTPAGAARARELFAKAKPFYHPIAADSIEKIVTKGQ